MSTAKSKAKPTGQPPAQDKGEEEAFLRSLRQHGQVVESDTPDVDLAPGQTHVYVRPKPGKAGQLFEKRKSFFKR